ncbi:copper resistance protein CopC [Shewanella sp. JBTF-M18]|uniref:Copper resistance protein C n=2 Tax=Bacteria TaxID=2 RepID=A0A6L7HTR6_9GAMM|nr:copper resistance CopC family protein [Shewanella insulae]MXR67699.1 copper resistance protein CopC [Shewanella insulae]
MKLVNIVLLVTTIVASSSVWAHVGLSSSMPAEGTMLDETPENMELSFSGGVRLVKVTLEDSKQNDLKLTMPTDGKFQDEYLLPLPVLNQSTYTVSWMAMGQDGHKMQGKFQFMIHGSGANTRTMIPMTMEKNTTEHKAHQ